MLEVMQWFSGVTAILIACVVLAVVSIVFVIVGFVKKKPVAFRIITIVLAVCFTVGGLISWLWLVKRYDEKKRIDHIVSMQEGTFDDDLSEPYEPVD